MTLWIDESFKRLLQPEQQSIDYFMSLTGQVYRAKEGRQTLRFEINGTPYFIKQHTGIGFAEIFKNLLSGRPPVTGAKNEWQAIARLTEHGIRCTRLLAYGERGLNPAKHDSFIVMETFKEAHSLEDIIKKQSLTETQKNALIIKLAQISRTMHGLGIYHRDYYLCHLMVNEQALAHNQADLLLYDLHRAGISKHLSSRWRIKDLASLYFSAYDYGYTPTREDIALFCEHYFEQPFDTLLKTHKKLLHTIEKKALKIYQRSNKEKTFELYFK
ncbi:MAG: lipopolysaccharide core heptose(I) kinase RfaP [Gammaproteobacteria bacterium CG11_big_fil_rev_8_21_14_0_20_46_22]|nr:MAG: lipopolysaccharide core heptose(I) kinase RfaP [Gammaproteobacteria bacterium CG12_big_fil_rev_8_21_14_0_65_46_12]PIR11266.1 MAG: lipopolysaccharide core heptose(I) kinase RfaP [Gammaproteobacteria bacterium CG11_big_fil_rev_8_21_14_0_20_46_22]